ncbi:Hsp70 family protein, partial [Geminocystis sp. CENA526]|uniref:Hsp70 family protein n=1 Tax=Geminocystis sp. CENA526 TaxID=1355871 RepID=UPI003D6DC894
GNDFTELGKAGDLWLGGDDIDDKLAELVKQKVAKEENLDSIDSLIDNMPYYQRVRFKADLKIATERAKIDLSSKTDAKVNPSTPLLDDFGMAIPISVTITRTEFEAIILPLVKRTIEICRDAVKYSDYPEDMIDIVLLVGGSSQIPLVQEEVKKAFGSDKVVVHPRPIYACAEGAGIVSAGVSGVMVGTVSRDYCIDDLQGNLFPLICQGEILPIKKSHTFKTEFEGQVLIHFKFFSSDKVREGIDLNRNDERIGDMWLTLDKSYPSGTEVDLMVELDEYNSALTMIACLKNNPSVKVSGSFSRGNQDEKIYLEVEKLISQVNQQNNLTKDEREKANQLAREIAKASNQIYLNGVLQQDQLQVANDKLKDLQTFLSQRKNDQKNMSITINFVHEKITPNPYDVLEVSSSASKAEITKAFAIVKKKKRYNPKQIAEARKQLMDNQQRIIADYLRPNLPLIQRFKKQDLSQLNEVIPVIKLLPQFDNLDKAYQETETVSEEDKKLGLELFS